MRRRLVKQGRRKMRGGAWRREPNKQRMLLMPERRRLSLGCQKGEYTKRLGVIRYIQDVLCLVYLIRGSRGGDSKISSPVSVVQISIANLDEQSVFAGMSLLK